MGSTSETNHASLPFFWSLMVLATGAAVGIAAVILVSRRTGSAQEDPDAPLFI